MKMPADIRKQTSDLPEIEPKCPICGKPSLPLYRPFCSKRCADVDLNRWLSGVYTVPTDEEPSSDEIVSSSPDEKI